MVLLRDSGVCRCPTPELASDTACIVRRPDDGPGRRKQRNPLRLLAVHSGLETLSLTRNPRAQTDTQYPRSRFASSTRREYEARSSPDGTRVAFTSHRLGHGEIWVCDSDGSNPRAVTNTGPRHVGWPNWSPDGKYLAYDAAGVPNRERSTSSMRTAVSRVGSPPIHLTMPSLVGREIANGSTSPRNARGNRRSGRSRRTEARRSNSPPQAAAGPTSRPDGQTCLLRSGDTESGRSDLADLAAASPQRVLGALTTSHRLSLYAVSERGIYFIPGEKRSPHDESSRRSQRGADRVGSPTSRRGSAVPTSRRMEDGSWAR